jgi:hypothetical protein
MDQVLFAGEVVDYLLDGDAQQLDSYQAPAHVTNDADFAR